MTNPQNKTNGTVLSWLEKSLFLAGLVAISLWAWSYIFNSVGQSWGNWAFEQKLHGQAASVNRYVHDREEHLLTTVRSWFGGHAKTPSAISPAPNLQHGRSFAVKHGELMGRVVISRLQVNAPVREGASDDTLDIALGHISGTAFPGQPGNVGVAGHRDTLFRGLRGVKKDDVIEFETLTGTYSYQVESTQIVSPDQVSVLNATEYPVLTLVTCYPFNYIGSAPKRFIVKARQISDTPPKQELAEAPPVRLVQAASRHTSTLPSPRLDSGVRRVDFQVSENHSLALGSDVLIGVSSADAPSHRMNGWMWVVPDRRTIWLRNRTPREPMVFYGANDGRKRELVITRVSKDTVAGYLLLFG